mmetsp:Transcript_127295/g.189768  ORF Transcript_127295/g.189768 Transcript_127295/m.189768 type:complete len:253 (-) Transcript_127295:250-1008(-)
MNEVVPSVPSLGVASSRCLLVDRKVSFVLLGGKRLVMQYSDDRHFQADKPILQRDLQHVRRPLRVGGVQKAELTEQGQCHALPKCEEDDGLDEDELENRIPRCKFLSRSDVELKKTVHGPDLGQIGDNEDVGVGHSEFPSLFSVDIVRLANEHHNCAGRLHQDVLERAVLAPEEHFRPHFPWGNKRKVIQWRKHLNGGLSGKAPNCGLLTTKNGEQVLQEAVNCKRFVRITNDVQVDRPVGVAETDQRADGV